MDRAELRRLAEALVNPRWERDYPLPNKDTAEKFKAAASPDVVLGLLDEIEAQEQAAIATEEIAHKLGEERDQLRAVAVRLKGALENVLFEDSDKAEAYRLRHHLEARSILADPEVEKL